MHLAVSLYYKQIGIHKQKIPFSFPIPQVGKAIPYNNANVCLRAFRVP